MFHLVYYAKSLNLSSYLEGVPLEVFKKYTFVGGGGQGGMLVSGL